MRKLHLNLAVMFGVIFVVLAISGSVLTFRGELQQVHAPVMGPDYLDLDTLGINDITAVLAKRYAGLQVRSVTLPSSPQGHPLFSLRYQQSGEARVAKVYVDPVTAQPRVAEDYRNPFEHWIYRLHSGFLLAGPGNRVVGVVGAGTLIFLVAGGLLWWQGRHRLKSALLPSARSGAAQIAELHRTLGIYLLPLLFVVISTGVMLVFRQALIFPFQVEPSLPVQIGKPLTVSCVANRSLERYLFIAEEQFPDAMATHIKLPRRLSRPVEVTLQHDDEIPSSLGLTKVLLDVNCGTVIGVVDGRALSKSEVLTETVVALHNGSLFGLPGRVFYVFIGLLPLFFAVSGCIIWARRRLGSVRSRLQRVRG